MLLRESVDDRLDHFLTVLTKELIQGFAGRLGEHHDLNASIRRAQRVAALPDVDMARVNSMKEAIASGKISVDIDSLAGAIEKYYQR